MKKLVPDPPLALVKKTDPDRVTAERPQAVADYACTTRALPVGRHNLLTVRPGASTEETLRHVALLLLGAEQVSDEIQEIDGGVQRGLIWSMINSVEISRALVEALLQERETL